MRPPYVLLLVVPMTSMVFAQLISDPNNPKSTVVLAGSDPSKRAASFINIPTSPPWAPSPGKTPKPQTNHRGLSTGAIAGIAIGGTFSLLLLISLAICLSRRATDAEETRWTRHEEDARWPLPPAYGEHEGDAAAAAAAPNRGTGKKFYVTNSAGRRKRRRRRGNPLFRMQLMGGRAGGGVGGPSGGTGPAGC